MHHNYIALEPLIDPRNTTTEYKGWNFHPSVYLPKKNLYAPFIIQAVDSRRYGHPAEIHPPS